MYCDVFCTCVAILDQEQAKVSQNESKITSKLSTIVF